MARPPSSPPGSDTPEPRRWRCSASGSRRRQALDWGLINEVVPDDELESASTVLLEKLANGPTLSYAGAKQLLNRRLYADLAGQLDAEADAQRGQGQSKDFIEGVIAFAEKRQPKFTGS